MKAEETSAFTFAVVKEKNKILFGFQKYDVTKVESIELTLKEYSEEELMAKLCELLPDNTKEQLQHSILETQVQTAQKVIEYSPYIKELNKAIEQKQSEKREEQIWQRNEILFINGLIDYIDHCSAEGRKSVALNAVEPELMPVEENK